jgi:hypothetical protein
MVVARATARVAVMEEVRAMMAARVRVTVGGGDKGWKDNLELPLLAMADLSHRLCPQALLLSRRGTEQILAAQLAPQLQTAAV